MEFTYSAIGILLAAHAVGCANVRYKATNAPPHAVVPSHPDRVEVFREKLPSRPYVQVGVIRALRSVPEQEPLLELRQEAAARGCEAIVFMPAQQRETSAACLVYNDIESATAANSAIQAQTLPVNSPSPSAHVVIAPPAEHVLDPEDAPTTLHACESAAALRDRASRAEGKARNLLESMARTKGEACAKLWADEGKAPLN